MIHAARHRQLLSAVAGLDLRGRGISRHTPREFEQVLDLLDNDAVNLNFTVPGQTPVGTAAVSSSCEELASSLKLATLLALLVSSNAARRERLQFSARPERTLRIVS